MTDDATNPQLIVRQFPAATAELEELLQVLQGEYGLDTYTARQRLIGPGLVMFGKGGLEKTGKIASLLGRYGFACWQVNPKPSQFIPSRLISLKIHPDALVFTCKNGETRLQRGTQVLGVFADISGALIDKHIKRVLAQNSYRGRAALEPLSGDEMIPVIFQGRPVFDFYLFDSHGQVQNAVRVLPGKFHPAGLGELATLSSRGNLEAVMALVEEYAQPFALHCDFGLSQLPQCQVERLTEGSSALEENLKSLNRYGWLLTQLQGDGHPKQETSSDESGLVAGVAVAAMIGQPALGALFRAAGGTHLPPGFVDADREMRDTLRTDQAETRTTEPEEASAKKDLPPPPERPGNRMPLRRMLMLLGSFAAVALLVLVMEGDNRLLLSLVRNGTRAGAVPGLIASGLLWSGLYFVRLKRQIENTPTSKVRSIAMGLVEVHGRAWRQYALVAPMTQSACVYYRLRKYRREKENKWVLTKDVDSSHVPFQIDDGTGRVIIDPLGASINAKTRQTGAPGQSPLTFTAFDSADSDEKWVEDVIYEGASLYVLGFARPLRARRRSIRERSIEKLRELKLDRHALHGYDTDADGQVSENEWQVARSDAEQAALKEQLADTGGRKRQEEYLVIAQPSQRGMPFIVTEMVSEASLTRNYGLISIPLLLIGLLTAGFALLKFIEFLGA